VGYASDKVKDVVRNYEREGILITYFSWFLHKKQNKNKLSCLVFCLYDLDIERCCKQLQTSYVIISVLLKREHTFQAASLCMEKHMLSLHEGFHLRDPHTTAFHF